MKEKQPAQNDSGNCNIGTYMEKVLHGKFCLAQPKKNSFTLLLPDNY